MIEPRTDLGRILRDIRERAMANGLRLLSEQEIELALQRRAIGDLEAEIIDERPAGS